MGRRGWDGGLRGELRKEGQGARLPDALAHRGFGTSLAGVGVCRDRAGSGHVPRVSRSGWLDAAGKAGEQRRLGARRGDGDAHAGPVSVIRAAILSSRARKVVNSALAKGCGCDAPVGADGRGSVPDGVLPGRSAITTGREAAVP